MNVKPISVTQGIRSLGIATAGNPFYGHGSPRVFADCIDCDISIIAHFEENWQVATNVFTDAEAITLFESYGWSIKPTLCPKCKARHQAAQAQGQEGEK